jgi:hypothetical protein
MLLTDAGAVLTGSLAEIVNGLIILVETFHMSHHFTLRCTALMLLTAGYGWAGGHFIPAESSPWAYVFQFVILLLLLVFGVGFLTASAAAPADSAPAGSALPTGAAPKRLRWHVRALSIFAGLTLVINIANIVQGAVGGNANGYGSHNSFGDLVPIGMILGGDVIWLLSVFPVVLKKRPFIG